jgi:hypothetical protein
VGSRLTTDIDLVYGYIEGLGEALLGSRARFMLVLEMGLENVVLLLCEARLDVGGNMGRSVWGKALWRLRGAVWRVARLHGGRAANGQQDGREQTKWVRWRRR